MSDINMKVGTKTALAVGLAVLLIALLGYFVLFFPRSDLAMRIFLNYAIDQAQQRRVLLLCKTDHQALLKAGREILSQLPEDYLNTASKRVAGNRFVPEGVGIPQAIQDIRPHTVLIDYDGYLTIEMHGGMDHFGVNIYPDDFRKPRLSFRYGDRELLPGLWYYDEGYVHNPEYDKEYDKRIDTLIEEHK